MAEWGVSTVGAFRTILDVDQIGETLAGDGATYVVDAGEDLTYAIYVEFGTSQNRAQPFLRPGRDSALLNIESILQKAVFRAGGDESKLKEIFPRLLAEHAEEVAKDLVPVDTGKLRESIQVIRVE